MRAKRKTPVRQPQPVGRARKDEITVAAREIADAGLSLNFKDVLRNLDRDDAVTLQLWATAADRDEIDRLCDRAREPMRRR